MNLTLGSYGSGLNAAVIGSSGGIGRALVENLDSCKDVSNIFGLSRSNTRPRFEKFLWQRLDLEDERSIQEAAADIKRSHGELHIIIMATGILHDNKMLKPERSWRAIEGPAMEKMLQVNTIGPALVAKHFLPLLATGRKSVFAALSGRVGSIADNRLGGWHSYRASKAALNMLIKTLAVELARRNPTALCVGLHPGTVDTALSKPFQANVSECKLFTATQSARHLLAVLDHLAEGDSGFHFAWDGSKIPF